MEVHQGTASEGLASVTPEILCTAHLAPLGSLQIQQIPATAIRDSQSIVVEIFSLPSLDQLGADRAKLDPLRKIIDRSHPHY